MNNPAAVLRAVGKVAIEDREVPQPGPGQVQVRIRAVGICGSDVHYYQHGRIGSMVLRDPMIIGHEAAGDITAVGPGVDPVRVGELVALEPGVPCRMCRQCREGRYNLCPEVRFFATPPIDGVITHYVVHDADYAHPAAGGLTAEQAAMAEPVSVGIWACRRAEVTVGDRVVITGAGPVGLLAAQVARSFGATTVVLTDLSPYRLDVARSLGFDAIPANESLPADGFDVFLECSGARPAFSAGLKALARGGRAVLIGMGAEEQPLTVDPVQRKELSISGVFRYRNTYPTALELLNSSRVQVEQIITHRFDLDQTEDALQLSSKEPHSLKGVVIPA